MQEVRGSIPLISTTKSSESKGSELFLFHLFLCYSGKDFHKAPHVLAGAFKACDIENLLLKLFAWKPTGSDARCTDEEIILVQDIFQNFAFVIDFNLPVRIGRGQGSPKAAT